MGLGIYAHAGIHIHINPDRLLQHPDLHGVPHKFDGGRSSRISAIVWMTVIYRRNYLKEYTAE